MHRRHFAALLLVSLLVLVASAVAAQAPPRDLDALRQLYDRPAPPAAAAEMAAVEPAPPAAPTPPANPATPADATAPDDVFAWSEIAFESARSGRWAIYRMKPNFTEIVPAVVSAGHVSSPSLRPRGADRILFTAETKENIDIYSARPDGNDIVRLTDYVHDDILPVWSPDGTQIAFQSERTGDNDIYVMDADGSNERRLTTSDYFDGQPTWSPDGRHIAFASTRSGRYQIWSMAADGSDQRQLTNVFAALYPSWSPFDNVVAFSGIFGHATEDFFLDLFLMNADGTGIRQTASLGATDIHSVTWSPTGSHAAYVGTTWEEHHDELYVNSSYLYMSHWDSFYLRYDRRYEDDPLIWSASWASRDGQPPDPCAVNTPAIRAWRSAFISWLATDNLSGVARYDVEWRPAGATTWTPLTLAAPATTFTLDERQPGEVVEWRCRATDTTGHRADWATVTRTLVDGAPPSSTVSAVAAVDGDTVQVTWRGSDYGSGVAGYDVWVRAGTDGDWTRWQSATTALSAPFTGQPGQTYTFRSQAIDRAGIREPWRPMPQAQATLGTPDPPAVSDTPDAPTATVRALLPLVTAVLGSADTQDVLSIADWPTLGGNAGHTGVNPGDPGASRYARVWSTEIDTRGLEITQQVTSADGVVLVMADEEYSADHPHIVALNVETGVPLWGFESALYELSHPPAIAHGAVYFGQDTYSSDLMAVDLQTGRKFWEAAALCEAGSDNYQHPLVVGNRIYLGVGRALDDITAATGQSRWHFSDHCYTNGSSGWAAAYYGGRVYYRPGGYLVELDATSGELLWSIDLYGDYWRDPIASPVVTADAILSANYDLTVLDRQQRRIDWTIEAAAEDYFSALTMPAVTSRVVYALRGAKLLAYNLDSGAEMWRFTANSPLIGAPVVAGNYVYVASATHTYVLNRQTYAIEWDVPVGGILSVANGYLFIAETVYSVEGNPGKAILHAYRAQEP